MRTLKNAFEADRIAHAFVLTGLRGIGKTTTARIIAKGLNCIGTDGQGGPTIEPCGKCSNCQAITEGNHVDILEIDAASNTGVQNVRDVIIDTVAYAPSQGRYKVFIIDEVHMLSSSAFNALLKTLEEPPEHVKFIFATTEIRKVPVTVLSRCQRFDLRRFEPEVMIEFLRDISDKESAQISDEALALIARAAEGSARDALSLLDQAIAHGGGETDREAVRLMLGLSDRGRVIDLLEFILRGEPGRALQELASQYADGADPMAVLRDLAEVTHWISVVKISPEAAEDPTVSPDERTRGVEIADRLHMRVLSRMWQMLLKALDEVAYAPNAMMAAEMAVIRLTHVSDLPTPTDLVRKLRSTEQAPVASPPSSSGGGGGGVTARAAALELVAVEGAAQPASNVVSEVSALARFARFEDVVALTKRNRDISLQVEIESNLRLVSYAPGRIEFEPTPDCAPDLAQRMSRSLHNWTGVRWAVSVVQSGGAATISEVNEAARNDLVGQAKSHPLVQAALTAFPGAAVNDVRVHDEGETLDPATPIDDVDDDWNPLDPFEED